MTRFRNFLANEKHHKVLVPIIAVILGFLLGTIIILLSGENPVAIFKSMVEAILGIKLDNIGELSRSGDPKQVFYIRKVGVYLLYVMPILLTGLSVAFAFRTGLFNIGAQGQLLMGSFAATWIGITFDLPAIILIPMVVLGGAILGGIWGFIPGYLKARFNVHEVVVTIMLNYTALHLTNYLMKEIPGSDSARTVDLNDGARLTSDFLDEFTMGSGFHFGFIIVILAVIAFWFIINKTTFGYELKAVGYNPHAAEYAGMKVKRNAALSMAISGAFAGLAGVILVTGEFGYGRIVAGLETYGFDGIIVALVGGNTAIGSVFGGLLMGSLKAAQPLMQGYDITKEIAVIISGSIIVFVAMQKGISGLLKKLKVKGAK